MTTTEQRVGPKRYVMVDDKGEQVGRSYYRAHAVPAGRSGLPRAPMKAGNPKLTARVYDIADALALEVRAGRIGGWWLQSSKGARWLIQTDPDGAWPTDDDPCPTGCVALTDAAVRQRYGIGDAKPAPKKQAKRTRNREPLVYNGDDPAHRAAAAAVNGTDDTPKVDDEAAEPAPSSPVGTPQEVTDWLERLIHLPKRAYAAAYCDAILNGAPMPDDPGTEWAAKARRRADRVLSAIDG